ncbi:MAG: NAD/NADP octopine/nopaline dehydrogenase family protein [Gemmobacter sp.]|nr:NAD/NADP octopine/nopaline dehydrogenase family protein [Gemmobacter sp.]
MASTDLRIAFLGMGAAGSGLAIETVLRGGVVTGWHDPNTEIADAVAFRGGLSYEGILGNGAIALPPAAGTSADAVRDADVVFVSSTADKHTEVATAIAPALRADQIVILHCGYVGGTKVFADALAATGGVQPRLFELNNTLHLAGKIDPATFSARGAKKWLEIAGNSEDADAPGFRSVMKMFPEFEFSDNVLRNGLNNPNFIGHVPAYIGNAVLHGRDLGDMTSGILHFHEARMGRVNTLCAAVEAERNSLIQGLGLTPLPTREFDRRAYPAGSRLIGGVARFGPKLQRRYVTEDLPCALVPIESIGRHFGIETPLISSLINLVNVFEGVDFRQSGRTVKSLSVDWVESFCARA